MCVIYVVEDHDQILDLWRFQGAKSLRILHLDSHCDMRGLLIDRSAQVAYPIWAKSTNIDQGNFLTHAFLEGRISGIRWVYGEQGGRQYDVGTVKYTSDFTALPYRWLLPLLNQKGLPIQYEVLPYSSWNGLNCGEYLDIDWDYFAGIASPEWKIEELVKVFLTTEFAVVPDQVYVCYSPDFSHPSKSQFDRFITDLSKVFEAEVVSLAPKPKKPGSQRFYRKWLPTPLFRVARHIYYSVSLELRTRGIY
jgi:hypothetical protein